MRIALVKKKNMYTAIDAGMYCGCFISSSVDRLKLRLPMKYRSNSRPIIDNMWDVLNFMLASLMYRCV